MNHIDTRSSIKTKYLGPTNHRGSRIVVTDDNNAFHNSQRITVNWNYELNVNENHAMAAQVWLSKNMTHFEKKYNQKACLSEPGLSFNGCYYWSWTWSQIK